MIAGKGTAMVAYADKDATFRYVNARYAEFYARQPGEFIGRAISEIIGELRWREIRPLFRHVLTGNETSYRYAIPHGTGGERVLEITLVPYEREGAVEGVFSLAQDITERIRADRARRESAIRLREFGDIIPAMIAYCDAQYVCHYANRRFLEFYAEKDAPVEGKHMAEVVGPETCASARPNIKRALAGETIRYTTSRNRIDGISRQIDVTLEPDRDSHGAVIGAHVFVFDVTDGWRAEVELRVSEARFRAVFERSKAGIATWGRDGRFLTVNGAFCDFVGYAVDEIVGKMSAGDLRQPGEDEGLDLTGRMLRGEISHITRDRRYRRRDASTVWGRTTVAAVTDKDGIPQYFVTVVIDITEAREAREHIERINVGLEERVEARTSELRSALKELDSFAYSVSHDLRAPVGAVNGFAHLLRANEGPRLSEDGKYLLGMIERNSERMVNLIEGLLRLSQLGRNQIRRVRLFMGELARDALRIHQGAPGAEVQVGPLPDCEGDPVLIGQVWANLIGNALKYSRTRERPRISVGWNDEKQAYFVRDNGVGFDMQYAGKLFGAFERLHSESEFEGSGIGLAIVHRIVERHGGVIWAEAAVDHGATFWFTAPSAPPNG